MENNYQPFGPEWEKEISKLTLPELVSTFNMNRSAKEKKEDFIKRIGRTKLAEKAQKSGFYIISLISTLRHEDFIQFYNQTVSGFTICKEFAGIFPDIDSYNLNNQDYAMAISRKSAEDMFVERLVHGKKQLVILNNPENWNKLGVKMETIHLIKIL